MELLPLGSVVTLKNGEQKIMIIARFPLTRHEETEGYYEYGACLYPQGQIKGELFFFNSEDIDSVHFKGYVDEAEEVQLKAFEQALPQISYPRFTVDDSQDRS